MRGPAAAARSCSSSTRCSAGSASGPGHARADDRARVRRADVLEHRRAGCGWPARRGARDVRAVLAMDEIRSGLRVELEGRRGRFVHVVEGGDIAVGDPIGLEDTADARVEGATPAAHRRRRGLLARSRRWRTVAGSCRLARGALEDEFDSAGSSESPRRRPQVDEASRQRGEEGTGYLALQVQLVTLRTATGVADASLIDSTRTDAGRRAPRSGRRAAPAAARHARRRGAHRGARRRGRRVAGRIRRDGRRAARAGSRRCATGTRRPPAWSRSRPSRVPTGAARGARPHAVADRARRARSRSRCSPRSSIAGRVVGGAARAAARRAPRTWPRWGA